MLNLTFSKEKNRELSPFEAQVRSIRRRLKDPLGRKSRVVRVFPTRLHGHAAAMGGKRNRRKEANEEWEAIWTDDDGTTSHNIPEHPQTGVVEGDGSNSKFQIENQSSGRSRHSNGDSLSQPKPKASLGPWTQAVSEAIQEMSATQQAIKILQVMFMAHNDELSKIDNMKSRLAKLEQECGEKDAVMQRHENTITTLRSMDEKAKAGIERELENIQREKEKLKQEETKLNSRIEVATAEERHKMHRGFQERRTELDLSHDTRRKELEAEFARRNVENSEMAAALRVEKSRLSNTVQQQEKTINAQKYELEQVKEKYDILERAKDSFKNENKDLKAELEMMKEEFALSIWPINYFTDKFAEIQRRIEAISDKYFHDIEKKDLDKVHDQLTEADTCFKSVPIQVSDDSQDLRTAHAQRVISKALYEQIWKPFGSELTSLHPEFSNLLDKISDNLDRSNQNGRVAKVWTALTMRALESLAVNADTMPVLEPKQYVSSTGSVRTDNFISRILGVLSPLVDPAQISSLQADLLALVSSSVDVWNKAQAGGLKISINPILDRAHHEEWRSQQFDQVVQPSEIDEQDLGSISRTYPRVYTLFPRIVAQIKDNLPPGGWPEPELVIIHPGTGLPEWSPLVIRGKTEQEERQEYITEVLEKAKQELHSSGRVPGHSRKKSGGSSISGPPSPSTQWKMGGAMKFEEK